MKKTWLRIAASLLATVLFITSAPLGIFAGVLDDILNGGLLEDDSSASASGTNTPTIEVHKYPSSPVYQIEYVGWEDEQTEFRQDETGVWIIDSPNALRQFEEKVNGENSFDGDVELRANIDYSGDVAWTPVGYHKDRPFMGTFNGCGHEIINLDITYNSENTVDSEVYYIGFFGYVKDATVQDFGIYSYSVDQDYNYDVEIGGMVGHSENSTFINCYADGEIKTGFEAINPLERDDVKELTSVPSSLNYENSNGQGVIIDLTNASETIDQTVVISGDVSVVKFIGKSSKIYKTLNIRIENSSWSCVHLVFEHFTVYPFYLENFSGHDIYISSPKGAYLEGACDKPVINIPDSTLTFCDTNALIIRGGYVEEMTNGQIGVIADRIVMNTEGEVRITGGEGSDGCYGGDGADKHNNGATGENGGDAGSGSDGYLGGFAVHANHIKAIKGHLVLYGGDSGDGGNGGEGGNGAQGTSGTWFSDGGTGGTGGKGGDGGDAYYGTPPTNNTPIITTSRATVALVNGADGKPGEAGAEGVGGPGGVDGGLFSSAGSPGASKGPGTDGVMLSHNYSYGLFDTEVFGSGKNNPFTVYQNTSAGVTLSVQKSSSWLFPYEIKVTSQGGASPWHLGGIVKSTQGSVGKVFYSVVYAKLPVGYRLGACSNSLGNNSYTYFLTSNEGTGDYKWYVVKTQCGDSGTIQDLGYLALYGDQTAKNVVWNVAYYNIYEASAYSVEDVTGGSYVLSDATATIGGFAGVVDKDSTLIKCATTIDIDRKQEYGARFEKNGHYYQLFANKMGYYEAKAFCESLGGYLTTITSAEENSFVYSLTAGHQIWLGGSDRAEENTFRWETGEAFSYENWHSGEPNNGTVTSGDGQDYIQMWEGGTWDDMYCGGETRSFICEWDSHTFEGKFAGVQYGVAREVIAAKRDDEGNLREHDYSKWFGNREMYNGHQYAYIPCYLTFDEAIEFCEELGGHLATIGSAQENAWVHSVMQGSDMWLGGTDLETEGEFKWITGEPFEYSNWAPGEPNNVGEGGQHYAQMYLYGTWNDVGERKLPFVCEWDSETADADIAVLNKFVDNEKTYNDVDAQGLVYSNDITAQNNRVSECAVLGKVGEACDVTVPACVFGGRFIMDVTSIAKYALARYVAVHPYGGSLKSFTSGKNVNTIEEYAFFKSDVTSVSIGTLGDDSEGQVRIEIGEAAFEGCTALTEITLGDCVVSVGKDLLKECNSLQSIRIGASLTSIPEVNPQKTSQSMTPFGLVKKESVLKEYVVSERNLNFTSVDGILYENFPFRMDDGTGREINLPVAVIDAPVQVDNSVYKPENYYVVRIYPYAFSYNKKITEVHLDYIREVGTGAFENCTSLTKVIFGELEIADDDTVKILDVEYPNATEKYSTSVGTRAFAGCNRLSQVNLDSDVLEQIGIRAFYDCATADEAAPMEIVLGKNIRMIAATDKELYQGTTYSADELYKRSFASAFEGANVKSFAVVEGSESFVALDGVLFYKSGETTEGLNAETLWLAAYPISSPREEYSAGEDDGDEYCTFRVAPYAFAGAKWLEKLTIGDNITSISDHALDNMAMLDTLTLGKNVKEISPEGDGITVAFIGCKNLHAIEVDEENEAFRDVDGVLMTKDGTTLIKYPEAKPGAEYVTPENVTKVMANAFKGNVLLQSVTFSSEITKLGSGVFNECANLSLIYFKTGEAPFTSKEAVDESNAFFTGHPRAMVCYGEKTSRWETLSGDYWSKETTLNGNKVRLFTIKEYTIPEDYEENTGYYVFVVLDKSGAMLNNINVNLVGSNQSIDTINGIAVFYDLDYTKPYKLTVFDNTGEYFPFENASFYLDEKTRITYITLSSVPTVSGVNVEYTVDTNGKINKLLGAGTVIGDNVDKVVDINSQTAKINKWCINNIAIKVTTGMDSDVSILGYSIVQDGQKKKTQTDSATLAKEICEKECESYSSVYQGKRTIELTTSISTEYLDVEKDVYIIVHFSDGSQVPCKLNIHVFELSFADINLSWLTEGFVFEINKSIFGFLTGGANWEIEFPKIGVKFETEIEEDSFKITIVEKEVEEDPSSAKNWECKLQGSVEIKYDGQNGIQVISTVAGVVNVSIPLPEIPTITVVCIPVKIEMELDLSNKLQFKLVFDDGRLLPAEIEYELKATFEFRAGVGCKMLSLGVYGNIELIFLVGIYPEFEMEKIELSGDVGLYCKLDLGIVKLEAKFSLLQRLGNAFGFNTTAVIYDKDKGWFPVENNVSASGSRAAEILYDESNYVLATSSFDPQTMTFSLTNIFEDPEETYAGIAPQMIQVGDLVYIVYHEDLNGYSDLYDQYNYQKLVYQIYNMTDDSFSDVYVLDDNGLTDGGFELFTDGKNVVIAYTQSNVKLTEYDQNNIENYIASMEIKTAVLKDGKFTASETSLTNDKYYDMYLHVGELGGKITAVWVRNEDNTMFGTTQNNALSIWYSVFDEELSTWSAPECLRDEINTITDVAIGGDSVVYITDVNNDLTTVTTANGETTIGTSDRLITVLKLDGEEIIETVTAEEAAYHDVSCVDGKIVYYVDNNLYEMDTEKALFKSAVTDLPSEYKVLTDANGYAKAILFVKNVITDGETGANEDHIYGIFRDGDQWGAPICLTTSVEGFGNGALINAYAVIDRGDEMLLSVLLHTSAYNPESEDEYNQYTMEYQYETVLVPYPTDYEMGDVAFDYESIIPNNEVTLSVTVTNLGYQTLTKVPVEITWKNFTFTDEIETVILPGETEIIEVKFNPGDATEEKYNVRIQDDECSVTLWYSDVAVYGKQVIIGGTYYVVAYVVNNGTLPAAYTMTVVAGDTELDPIEIENLLPSNKTHYTIPLPVTQNGSELVTLSIEADQEYITNNNIALINITTEPEQRVETEFNIVWASVTEVVINRSNPTDQTIKFDGCYELVSILMNDTDLDKAFYDYDRNSVTIYSQKIADKFENGSYTLKLNVTNESSNDKYAEITVIVTETVKVTWVENESTRTETDCLLGDIPTREAPEKESDEQYHYVFVGWDCNDDGVADPLSPVMRDTVFVAIYDRVQREYTVTWIIDEDQSIQKTYGYGEMPVFSGTPTKPSTDQYDYRFIEWDQTITEVTSDVIYTAVFEQSLRKYTITVHVDQSVYTMQVEYGMRPILVDPVKESTEQYDFVFGGWSPMISEVYGDQTYVATFTSKLREYTVTWIVDGVETSEQYQYGTTPVYAGIPFKQGNKQYMYDFVGWDHEITRVVGDATYEARFQERLNFYTVSFVVNENTYKKSYTFGEIPFFEGSVSKPSDGTYRYTFIGWDREFAEVTEDTVYIAQFEKTLLGSATVTNTSFVTAWNCSFATTISLENVSNMTESKLTVYFNPLLVSLQSYNCYDNVQVLESGAGYITLLVSGLRENEVNNLIELIFVTSTYAPVGESEFINVFGEDLFDPKLGTITIFQMGDVNMDGRVNTVDAAMIQRYAVKKLDLNEVQKVYGNVNGDTNQDGTLKLNTVDAAMIQRFAVKKIDTLGNRITVTFSDGEAEERISLVVGSTLSDLFTPGDGYAWSLEEKSLVPVNFSTLTEDTIVYLVPTANT